MVLVKMFLLRGHGFFMQAILLLGCISRELCFAIGCAINFKIFTVTAEVPIEGEFRLLLNTWLGDQNGRAQENLWSGVYQSSHTCKCICISHKNVL